METTQTTTTRYVSEPAQAAKLLRADLKAAFPGIKFKVQSEIYSMGSSINVSWTNGPTNDAVDKIAHRYQYGTFDSMTDCAGFVEGFTGPGAKHVFAQRKVSDEIKTAVRERIAKQYDLTADEIESNYCKKLPESLHTMIHRYLVNVDLTGGLAAADEVKAKAEEEKEAEYQAWLASEDAPDALAGIVSTLAAQTYRANVPPVLVVLPRPAVCAPASFTFIRPLPVCGPSAFRFSMVRG